MQGDDIHAIEVAKWDRLAEGVQSDASLGVRDADFHAYCRRVGTMAGIGAFVGDLQDRDVLELGCGQGELTVLLARSGARVVAVDLSPGAVEVARRRAAMHGVEDRVELVVAPGERLPFPDERFDVVVGKAVLHHLDAAQAGPELYRVLRPGGRAAFAEPMGTNPLLRFARDRLPYPHKNPRGADIPLRAQDLRAWRAPFAWSEQREIQLLAMAERALGFKRLPWLRAADDWLLRRVPALRPLCRYVVLTMRK